MSSLEDRDRGESALAVVANATDQHADDDSGSIPGVVALFFRLLQ